MKQCKKAIFLCLLILLLLSLVRYTDIVEYWQVDLFSHFPVQYAFISIILFVFCLWKKSISLAVFAGFVFALNISVLSDSGASVRAAAARPRHNTFTVYSANIHKLNRDFPQIIKGLTESNADIMLLLEVTEENIKPVRKVMNNFPYYITNLNITSSGTGTVLLSRFPILSHKITKYSECGNMLVYAVLQMHNKKVAFYGAHLPRPTWGGTNTRVEQFRALAQHAAKQTIPVIVAGDFNATPYSPIFKELLKMSGLKDSRAGFGWQPSWPTFFPFLWIPIDHILTSPEIQVHNRATGGFTGSDHYPVIAELSI